MIITLILHSRLQSQWGAKPEFSYTGERIGWWRVWRKAWRRPTTRVGPGTFRTVVGLVSEEKYPKANSTKGWLKWK